MGLVRSPEEVAAMQRVMANPQFLNGKMLGVEFLTAEETVKTVLPPGLLPLDQPVISVSIGRWQSNCVGDFQGANLYVNCRSEVEDIVGAYALAMYMDTDSSLIFGRDLFGEPKKVGESFLLSEGSRMSGSLVRNGVPLIEIEANLPTENGPVRGERARFNVKASPAANGDGLEHDAVLTVAVFEFDFHLTRSGTGSIQFGRTRHDPLGEIEVVEVLGATYTEGDISAKARALTTIPANDFLPYALGRLDYWPLLNTAGRS